MSCFRASRCCGSIATPRRDRQQLEAIIGSVLSGEARILVGTQMVTKGHHFPGISLVVVLNADQGLFSTDFRAAERLAQTIVQVAGRAGRERNRGEVLIQTEYPEHPLLQSLLSGGYEGFAAVALAERAAARWPPFGRLAVLRASTRTSGGALDFLRRARGSWRRRHARRAPARPGGRGDGAPRRALSRTAADRKRRARPAASLHRRLAAAGRDAWRAARACAMRSMSTPSISSDALRLDSPPPHALRIDRIEERARASARGRAEDPDRHAAAAAVDPALDQRRARARCQPRRLRQQHRAAAGQGGGPAAARARRGDRRGVAAERAGRARRGGGRRVHQLPSGARCPQRACCASVLERGERYGAERCGARRARDPRIRLGQSDRAAARRPRPPGRLRRDARQSAARHRPRRAPRVLHQRRRPADGHPHASSTWLRYLERCGETLPFPSNGYRGDYVHAIAAQLRAAPRPRAAAPGRAGAGRAAGRCARPATRSSTSMR